MSSPSIWPPARLEAAHRLGADAVADVHEAPGQLVADLTDGLGADVVVEAVGLPESFELCTRMVRPGGHVANIGVHGKPAALHLEDLWSRNVTITTGLVDTYSVPALLRMAAAGRLPTGQLVTHTFPLHRMEEAYGDLLPGRGDRRAEGGARRGAARRSGARGLTEQRRSRRHRPAPGAGDGGQLRRSAASVAARSAGRGRLCGSLASTTAMPQVSVSAERTRPPAMPAERSWKAGWTSRPRSRPRRTAVPAVKRT